MTMDVLDERGAICWTRWCGHDPEDAVSVATRGGVLFASKPAVEAARHVWEERANELADVSSRTALARLIARRIGRTDDERGHLGLIVGAWAAGDDVDVRMPPSAPSAEQIARALREVDPAERADRLNVIRTTFFGAYGTLGEFTVWLIRDLWRAGAGP